MLAEWSSGGRLDVGAPLRAEAELAQEINIDQLLSHTKAKCSQTPRKPGQDFENGWPVTG